MQIIQNTKEQKKNSDLLLSLENELTDFRIFDAMVGVTNTTPTLTARLANARRLESEWCFTWFGQKKESFKIKTPNTRQITALNIWRICP